MFTQVAPSGVVVHSVKPFHPYTVWDRNAVLFSMRSHKFTFTRFCKQFRQFMKDGVR